MKRTCSWLLLPYIIVFAMLFQGCGQDKPLTAPAGSFGEAAGPGSSLAVPTKNALRIEPAEVKSAPIEPVAHLLPNSTVGPTEEMKKPSEPKAEETSKLQSQPQSKAATEPTAKGGSGKSATAPTSPVSHSPAAKQSAVNVKEKTGPQPIGWSQFFDGDDQTTPSEAFWDLSGSTVTIKGFMGEVLSFENNWFLLIPEPGAECPFDNGDETYWNKIMIVFVPEDIKLRYKSEPLEITGRLDVGIKIDESGYKTMFRLYDASFKEIKE